MRGKPAVAAAAAARRCQWRPGWLPPGVPATRRPAVAPTHATDAAPCQTAGPTAYRICNPAGNPKLWTQLGIGSVYAKAQYRQYTDASFQTLKPRPSEDEHLGNLGPLMRASVGQVLTVVLRNNLPFPVNLLPAGVQPADAAAGADGDAAAVLSPEVQPGQEATYRFLVPASMGPSELEPSAKLWLYRCGTVAVRCAGSSRREWHAV